MMARYVRLIKNRSLSEISHVVSDGITGSLSLSRSLSLGIAVIKEQNQLNLMDTSSGFWEILEGGIVFIFINAYPKFNYCAMSHVTLLVGCCPIAFHLAQYRVKIYLLWI